MWQGGDGKLAGNCEGEKRLIESSLNCSRDGVFRARALVRARPRIPIRILSVTNQDQVLSEGNTRGHEDSAVWDATI